MYTDDQLVNWKQTQVYPESQTDTLSWFTYMPTEASGVSLSKSMQRCVSGSFMVPHGQGLVILSVGSERTVAPVEFHAHKGLASFLNNGQRQSTRWNLVPWLWALRGNRSPLYHWTDKGCSGWWVGAELGSDWGLQGGPSWGRWGCIVSIKPGAYWSGWLESLPRHQGN